MSCFFSSRRRHARCYRDWSSDVCSSDLSDVRALDIAKRLIDYNFHPPTNYFPLIVHEALMIEPTETENKDTLDAFADAPIKIAEEARTHPDLLHNAPSATQFGTIVDEVKAARELILCCWLPDNYDANA